MLDLDNILSNMCDAPDSQIDAMIVVKLKDLIGSPPQTVADGLKLILDECAHASLASDFVMVALDTIMTEAYKQAKQ